MTKYIEIGAPKTRFDFWVNFYPEDKAGSKCGGVYETKDSADSIARSSGNRICIHVQGEA
jgi:hypothetical protein